MFIYQIHVAYFSVWLSIVESSSSATDDQQKASDELRKDASELGIEVIDQISAVAGNSAHIGEYMSVRECISGEYIRSGRNFKTNS